MLDNSISLNGIAYLVLGLFLQAMHEKPPINDPAIIMYSANSQHLPPHLFTTVSSSKNNSPLHSTGNMHSGNKAFHKHAKSSLANESIGEASSACKGTSLSDKVCLPQSPGKPGRGVGDTQLQHSTLKDSSAAPGLDHGHTTNKPVLPKPSEDIVVKLRTIFPHYTRYFFHGENVDGFNSF